MIFRAFYKSIVKNTQIKRKNLQWTCSPPPLPKKKIKKKKIGRATLLQLTMFFNEFYRKRLIELSLSFTLTLCNKAFLLICVPYRKN